MKLLETRALLLSLVAILFAATTADSIAQLTKIWEIKNFSASVEALSPNAKLAHMGGFLIDLTNGNIIDTKVSPERFLLTYTGDRYFVSNWQEKTMKVYDRYTKEFIQDVYYHLTPDGTITAPDDSTISVFDDLTHSLQFWNVYTNELKDSFTLPDIEKGDYYDYFSNVHGFSYDGRYFPFIISVITTMGKPHTLYTKFMIYDRVAREIFFLKSLPTGSGFLCAFMNTSNQLAYYDNLKLSGDDKQYSYIRIFDLDKREVVKDIKISNIENYVRKIVIRNDDKFILYRISGSDETMFYDTENQRLSDYTILIASPIFADDSIIVNINMQGYQFDWTVGVEDTNPIGEDLILYPNPSTNSVNLNIDEKYFNGKWQIVDLSGRIVLQGIIQPELNLQINVGVLQPQTYYLQLQKDNFTVTFPVVKI